MQNENTFYFGPPGDPVPVAVWGTGNTGRAAPHSVRWGGQVRMVARALGVELDEVRETLERRRPLAGPGLYDGLAVPLSPAAGRLTRKAPA